MKEESGDEGNVGTLDGGCRRMRRKPDTPRLWSCSSNCALRAKVVNMTVHRSLSRGTHLAMFSSCVVPASIEYRTLPLSAVSCVFDSRFPVLLFLCTYKDLSGTSKASPFGVLLLVLLLLPSCESCQHDFLSCLLSIIALTAR
jgi:hypothetical protein